MRIAVDAFGGDNAPLEIIKGAALAAREYSVDITLTGNEKTIREIIAREGLEFAGDLKIIDTDDVISMHDEPTSLVKAHKESSMAKAFYELLMLLERVLTTTTVKSAQKPDRRLAFI